MKIKKILASEFRNFLVSQFFGFQTSTFRKILIPYSRFSRNLKVDLYDCGCPSFPFCSKTNFKTLRFISLIFIKMMLDLSWIFRGILGSPKIEIIGFGSYGHVQKSRNHENEGFSVSPRSKSKMKQNNSTEISGYSCHNIHHRSDPKVAIIFPIYFP